MVFSFYRCEDEESQLYRCFYLQTSAFCFVFDVFKLLIAIAAQVINKALAFLLFISLLKSISFCFEIQNIIKISLIIEPQYDFTFENKICQFESIHIL